MTPLLLEKDETFNVKLSKITLGLKGHEDWAKLRKAKMCRGRMR